MHPGDHVRLGEARKQVPGVGDSDGTDEKPSGFLTGQHPHSAI